MYTLGLYQFTTIFRRDFINLILNPALVLTNIAFPFLLILAAGYLTNGNYGSAVSSYDYYGITLLIFTGLNVAMTATNSFMERAVKASNLRVLYAPIRPAYIYMAKIAATFVFTGICLLVLIALLRGLLHVNTGGSRLGYLLIMLLLLNLFAAAIGVLVCCLLRSEEIANRVIGPVVSGLALLGGLFFPLDGLSREMERISWFSPVKWVAEAAFRLIYDQNSELILPVTGILLGLTALAIGGCYLTFRSEDYV